MPPATAIKNKENLGQNKSKDTLKIVARKISEKGHLRFDKS
jgi:hypothetical protein